MICNSNEFSNFERRAEYWRQAFRLVLCDHEQQLAFFIDYVDSNKEVKVSRQP